MNEKQSDEIERIGLDNIAAELKTTPEKLQRKFDEPRLFKLSEIATLQVKFGFTDKMIRNLLRC